MLVAAVDHHDDEVGYLPFLNKLFGKSSYLKACRPRLVELGNTEFVFADAYDGKGNSVFRNPECFICFIQIFAGAGVTDAVFIEQPQGVVQRFRSEAPVWLFARSANLAGGKKADVLLTPKRFDRLSVSVAILPARAD